MAAVHELRVGDAMRRVTLEVRIVGEGVARFRMWLAAQIMKLAGLVAGCGIRVEFSDEFDDLPPLPRTRSWMMVGGIEVPRQSSVRPGSPLYMNPGEWGRKVDFYLDGIRQDKVVSYDVDAGYIRVLKAGPDGEPYVAGDEVATEIRQGRLEVRPVSVVP